MNMKAVRSYLCVLVILFCCIQGNVYYPGFKRNFWLEFSSPSPASERSAGPVSSSASPLRPLFLHPSTNGSVQTVTLGRSTRIDCMVTNLNGYQVSWLRRRGPEVSLLTTNLLVFSLDSRLAVSLEQDQHNWGLVIQSAQERDSGSYLCQVNTHPPATLMVHLIVIVPTLTTVDDQGHPVVEKYYKPGTTILLRCLVTNYRPDFPAPLWRREEAVVTESEKTRIKVEYGTDGSLESRLYLSGADSEDSGQYSCLMPGMEAVTPANINISITTGEETAAIQSNKAVRASNFPLAALLLMARLLFSGEASLYEEMLSLN